MDPRWEAAALARASGMGAHQAYLSAGYKGKPPVATVFFQRPVIAARVKELQIEHEKLSLESHRKALDESSVSRAWVIKHLKHNALAAMRGDPVYDRNGQPTGFYRPDRFSANTALIALGKTEGIFIERTEVGNPGDFSRMADDELDKALIDSARALGLPDEGLKMIEHLTKKREDVE